MTPEIRAQVIESRRRQGLPDTIQDPVVLTKLAAILLDEPTTPGAGSERGQRPTGCSVSASHAPGRGTEPAPVTLAGPNGDQPDDPWSPPGEPPAPGSPDPWVPNPTKRFKLLDLFSGAGGAARGYQLAGFHVTGVDVEPQPRYAGDEFHQADALTFPLDGFDVIHASPPCQHYANVTGWRGDRADHPDLIHPTRARLRHAGVPWVIENVPEAPLRHDHLLCGSMFGLEVKRHRAFETSWGGLGELQAPCGSHHRLLPFMHKAERAYADAMGCTWMTKEEAREAIPPAYATFIGGLLLAHLSTKMSRATAIPPDADGRRSVTAGTSPFDGRAPDGPGPAAALGPLFEAEVAEPVTAASPSGQRHRLCRNPAGEARLRLEPSPSRLRLVLVDDDVLWMLNPRRRVTIVQVAGGAL